MKVVCVDAYWDATNGFLGLGAKPKRPIEGLTEGKTYEGSPVTTVSGGSMNTSVSTCIEFLIFNDNEEWQTYSVDCFRPV